MMIICFSQGLLWKNREKELNIDSNRDRKDYNCSVPEGMALPVPRLVIF